MSTEKESWEILEDAVRAEDQQALHDGLDTLPSSEIARAISHMRDDDQTAMFAMLWPEEAARVLGDAQGGGA